jgi:hypothetical protein
MKHTRILAMALAAPLNVAGEGRCSDPWPQYTASPHVIELNGRGPSDGAGGVIATFLHDRGPHIDAVMPEEILVVNEDALHIFHNPASCPTPDRPRLWDRQHYVRSKQTYNYYNM